MKAPPKPFTLPKSHETAAVPQFQPIGQTSPPGEAPAAEFPPESHLPHLQHGQHRSKHWAHVGVASVPKLKGKAVLTTLSHGQVDWSPKKIPSFPCFYHSLSARLAWMLPGNQDAQRSSETEDEDPHLSESYGCCYCPNSTESLTSATNKKCLASTNLPRPAKNTASLMRCKAEKKPAMKAMEIHAWRLKHFWKSVATVRYKLQPEGQTKRVMVWRLPAAALIFSQVAAKAGVAVGWGRIIMEYGHISGCGI